MKIVTYILFTILTVPLFSLRAASQKNDTMSAAKKGCMFATNEFIAKGGIGIITEKLYIVLKSAKNELLLSEGERWVGLDASRPEVVIFFNGKVWSPKDLPDQFDLSHATIISFEGDKVRFFDFLKTSGGYYKRPGRT